ncbi:MAG TPA: hypothetical protein PKK23_18915 [Nitrospirales bacterium]|nr:hypothetical protein [Nitrospirales bacterium]
MPRIESLRLLPSRANEQEPLFLVGLHPQPALQAPAKEITIPRGERESRPWKTGSRADAGSPMHERMENGQPVTASANSRRV